MQHKDTLSINDESMVFLPCLYPGDLYDPTVVSLPYPIAGFNPFLPYSYDVQPQQLQQPGDLATPQYQDYAPQDVAGATFMQAQATPQQLQQQVLQSLILVIFSVRYNR